MRYLGLALVAEGPSDHRFLGPLLRRVAEELCARRAHEVIEISEVLDLQVPAGVPRAEGIVSAALAGVGAFDVLFVHADGDGDANGARMNDVVAAVECIRRNLGGVRGCGVVPVRETEAWALADGDALRRAFGTTIEDRALGVPIHTRLVEKIYDPKLRLKQSLQAAVGARRSKNVSAAAFLPRIAEAVSFERLHEVPSFRVLVTEVSDTLADLGYMEPV